ncbi:MAG: hypothetical protein HC853_07395 [Anaerolineae bacterium]|nr:hypothetical protein [Anaerolineae bacterium]
MLICQRLMSDPFTMAYWQSEGATTPRAEAQVMVYQRADGSYVWPVLMVSGVAYL